MFSTRREKIPSKRVQIIREQIAAEFSDKKCNKWKKGRQPQFHLQDEEEKHVINVKFAAARVRRVSCYANVMGSGPQERPQRSVPINNNPSDARHETNRANHGNETVSGIKEGNRPGDWETERQPRSSAALKLC